MKHLTPWHSSLKKFKLDERKSPKFLDDAADYYLSTHDKGITTAIGYPYSTWHIFKKWVVELQKKYRQDLRIIQI